jgi:aldose 1-epimerase
MKITKDMLARETLEVSRKGHTVKINIMPRLGANLCSFVVDGKELIYWSDDDLLKGGDMRGCFHMFPTPCRVPDGKYTFQGKTYLQTKHDEPVIIHGLLRDETLEVRKGRQKLSCSIVVTKDHPIYEGYPFPCKFTIDYRIIERGLEIGFQYQNIGATDAPFGYGLHPFWKVAGARKDTAICVPCEYIMELANLIPTGAISKVAGTKLDFRKPTSLEGVDVDNVFWKRDKRKRALVEYRADDRKLSIDASAVFNHMIAYAPAGQPFVCLEHLTCSPNHINVYKGLKDDVSGLIVAPPKGRVEGWVRYVLADL